MKRGRITLAAITVGAFALTACGDDDVDLPDVTDLTIPDVTVPDVTVPDVTLPDITVPDFSLPEDADSAADILHQFFPDLNDDQVDCVVDRLGGKVSDVASQIMDLLDDCNIQLNDLRPGS